MVEGGDGRIVGWVCFWVCIWVLRVQFPEPLACGHFDGGRRCRCMRGRKGLAFSFGWGCQEEIAREELGGGVGALLDVAVACDADIAGEVGEDHFKGLLGVAFS
jgi:hypothetical protein